MNLAHKDYVCPSAHYPTGETEKLRGFTGKIVVQDERDPGRKLNLYYYRGQRWYGPSNKIGSKGARS